MKETHIKPKKQAKKDDDYIWTCDYCGKEFETKKESDTHELGCVENPSVKNSLKKFLKPAKFGGIAWIVSVISFFAIAAATSNINPPAPGQITLPSALLIGSLIIGVVSFLIMVISLALNLSYAGHSSDTSLKKIFKFILSLIFLPFAVMRNLASTLFGFFILLPIWGSALLLLLFLSGIFTNSTPVIGNSMYPTIHDKENVGLYSYTFIQKFFQPLKRGDIIIFSSDRTVNPDGQISSYIKRVVAVSGDEVTIRDGFLYVNNELVKEPYTAKPRSTYGGSFLPDCKSIKVPDGYIFALGDNRKRSKDSREVGLVSLNEVESFLPVAKQSQFSDRSRDTSNDGTNHGLPSFDLADYYQRINQIRADNNLKPLKQNEKLESAALARAKSIIENNEINQIGSGDNGKYPYSKAIRDAGYSNIITGEIRTTGYYDSEELSNYWLDYQTKKNLLDKQFQDTGIAAYVGKIDGCEVQVIVQEFGGYVPPNYDKSNTDSWKSVLSRLREIQPSWQRCKEWGSAYDRNKTECDRINEIISIRINNIQAAVNKMDKNQWLSSAESKSLDQDQALFNEQESLANKLNNL